MPKKHTQKGIMTKVGSMPWGLGTENILTMLSKGEIAALLHR